jgi:hypothetical protein
MVYLDEPALGIVPVGEAHFRQPPYHLRLTAVAC